MATRAKLNQYALELEGKCAALVLERDAIHAALAEAREGNSKLNQYLTEQNAKHNAANLEREAILKQRDQAYADLTRAQQRLRDVREALDD